MTDELVRELRQTHQLKVVAGIESFTKRSAVRNIENTAGLDKSELGIVYDKFYNVLYYKQQKSTERNDSRMDQKSFQLFLGSLATWAKMTDDNDGERQLKVAQNFFQQLFKVFDINQTQSLCLQVKTKKGLLCKKEMNPYLTFFLTKKTLGCDYWRWIDL